MLKASFNLSGIAPLDPWRLKTEPALHTATRGWLSPIATARVPAKARRVSLLSGHGGALWTTATLCEWVCGDMYVHSVDSEALTTVFSVPSSNERGDL